MKKQILSLVAAAAMAGSAGANAQADEISVKKGDTLWWLSQKYEVTVNDIKQWNDLSSDMIRAETTLSIFPEKKYIIKSGDTLWAISRNYGVSVSDLMHWNNLSSDLIYPEQVLVIHPKGSIKEKPAASAPQKQEQTEKQQAVQAAEKSPAPEKTAPAESKPAESEASASTKPSPEASAPAAQEEEGKEITVTATAYTASCEGCSGVTSTGIDLNANPDQKVISVDPNVIPLGSKVYVEGYGNAIAGDTGGSIKGNKIDVFIPTKEEAIKFGRQTLTVRILD
ncbi:3D domain-containing protein [Bacillus infantis]|uniref:LysM peptidoglycan-binding domain-containing protein n=1 Tax=Bacillus infantis TaxID=324767 RepID=A0A5D4RDR9_9BACI|nr:3D domain-containing protein [Bacillus infantis]TYS47878.1 LysM peptidoglycan-binding domain-containing protein [Bacillus infantis]